MTLPITLLLSYSVILPPLIFWLLWKDLKVKRENFSTWHLDSCGLLAQRLIFSLLCLISILSLSGCVEKSTNTKLCIRHALIPIMIPILFVCLKVLLLKSQRMVMWGGFILCALAQMILLFVINAKFNNASQDSLGQTSNGILLWLMFIPSMLFGVLIDVESIIQTARYRPQAFSQPPK